MDAVLCRMRDACVALANLLRDVAAREECLRIVPSTVHVHASIIEYAASTLIASLAARRAQVDEGVA